MAAERTLPERRAQDSGNGGRSTARRKEDRTGMPERLGSMPGVKCAKADRGGGKCQAGMMVGSELARGAGGRRMHSPSYRNRPLGTGTERRSEALQHASRHRGRMVVRSLRAEDHPEVDEGQPAARCETRCQDPEALDQKPGIDLCRSPMIKHPLLLCQGRQSGNTAIQGHTRGV